MIKRFLFILACTSFLASGTGARAEEDFNSSGVRNHLRRWDFSCTFENGTVCRALASIYTRRSLMDSDLSATGSGGSSGSTASYPHKLAVQCENGGMLYANSANLIFRKDHMVISASGGYKPALVFDLPLVSETSQPVTLLRSYHDPISGTCSVHSKRVN
ncbi:MAG: hypothetical protein KGQ59_06340 [Bdellovibrionales bacterium]|nr:hypothetical protein [Bdellovibrionales bacterium]